MSSYVMVFFFHFDQEHVEGKVVVFYTALNSQTIPKISAGMEWEHAGVWCSCWHHLGSPHRFQGALVQLLALLLISAFCSCTTWDAVVMALCHLRDLVLILDFWLLSSPALVVAETGV